MHPHANVGAHAAPPTARRQKARTTTGIVAVLAAAALGGCALTPKGAKEEQARLSAAGEKYQKPFEQRTLPEIPAEPMWRDVLHRAFMANGELEASYFEWKAAYERIDIAAAWPNSNIALGYSYALGPGQMKTFDRMTFSGGIDSMKNLSFPTKVAQAGKVALDETRASGERFRAAKFDLQRRVLAAWADYSFLAEQARIQADQVTLTRAAFDTARSRVQAGGMQADLLRASVSLSTAEDALRTTGAELTASSATLNGLLARDPDAPLSAPRNTQEPRPLPSDDSFLLAAAVEQNPELAALSHGVEGRSDALERARQEWIPDINPFVSFTGGIAQIVGASVVLPTTIMQIEGGIREADAMLKASDAMLRQSKREKTATFVATLVLLRDAERQTVLFERTVVPATEQLVTTVRQRYSAGSATYLDLLDAQRTLLESRLVVARARTTREIRLAELEALMGADIETLGSVPAASPSRTPPK
ncbi:MAG: TolC family protein [Phycisphaerae bacterium]|nr:TolC family protein [Phycisphaerae bacterium]